jgi:hypothetical protein
MRTGIRGIPVLVGVAAVLLAAPVELGSQEAFDARPELVIGGPTAIGVLIPRSERWSLRVDGTAAGTVSGGTGVGPFSSWNFVVGVSALRHVRADGPLRPYLFGRMGYQRTMADASPATQVFYYGAGAGAQVRVHDRVAMFSELTAQFNYSRASSGTYLTAWNTTGRTGMSLRRKLPRE